MQVVYHLGAHCTETDRLLRALLKNRATLSQQGTVVASPARFRQVVRDALQSLDGEAASSETQEMLLDAIMDEDHADRLVLANENFLAQPAGAVKEGVIYPRAAERAVALRRLFPSQPVEFHIAIRSLSTYLPALFAKPKGPDAGLTLSMIDPLQMRWSTTIRAIRRACPDAPVTVWCDEDLPLVWEDVMRDVAGLDASVPLEGTFDLLGSLMSDKDLRHLRERLDGQSMVAERNRAIAEHLEEFGQSDALINEIDLPGWTQTYIDLLDDIYDEDVAQIAGMQGVDLISP